MKIKLVTRHCLCGCGLTFRVAAKNTTNYFYALTHVWLCHNRADDVGDKARAYLKARVKTRPKGAISAMRYARKTTYTPENCEFSDDGWTRDDDNAPD